MAKKISGLWMSALTLLVAIAFVLIILAVTGEFNGNSPSPATAPVQLSDQEVVALKDIGFTDVFSDRMVLDNQKGEVRFYPGKASRDENIDTFQVLLRNWEEARGKKEYWYKFIALDYSLVILSYTP